MKEPEEYKSFVYFYEGMNDDEDIVNQIENQNLYQKLIQNKIKYSKK